MQINYEQYYWWPPDGPTYEFYYGCVPENDIASCVNYPGPVFDQGKNYCSIASDHKLEAGRPGNETSYWLVWLSSMCTLVSNPDPIPKRKGRSGVQDYVYLTQPCFLTFPNSSFVCREGLRTRNHPFQSHSAFYEHLLGTVAQSRQVFITLD